MQKDKLYNPLYASESGGSKDVVFINSHRVSSRQVDSDENHTPAGRSKTPVEDKCGTTSIPATNSKAVKRKRMESTEGLFERYNDQRAERKDNR